MKRLILKLLWLSSPFILVGIGLLIIDPYNYTGPSRLISDECKINGFNCDPVTMPFGNTLWKMIEYRRTPSANVLIGDSRPAALDSTYIMRVAGQRYYNFALPGGDWQS